MTVVAVTIAALSPVVTAEFTRWDDPSTITDNPHLKPPTLAGLAHHWSHPHGELYVPMTYTAWWALARLSAFGASPDAPHAANPWLFHAVSLIVHVLAALLVLRLLTRLGIADWPACAGALVFAVHPVQVEAVAWASGLKDLLAGAFALAALNAYVSAARETFWRHYSLSLLAYVAAILAKPTAMAMPLIALVIDGLILRRPLRDSVRWLVPFVVLAIPCFIWSKYAQPSSLIDPVPLWTRPFVAADAVAFYLYKLIWPARLAFDYGRDPWGVIARGAAYVTAGVSCALAAALVIFAGREPRRRVWLAAAAVFVAGLLPVLGLVPFEFQGKSTTADHYLYVPMLGVAIVVAAAAQQWAARHRQSATALLGVLIVILAGRSWLQARTWRDSETLFEHALVVNPRSAPALTNLTALRLEEARAEDAEALARRAIATHPNDPAGPLHLGHALALQRRYEEAADVFRAAALRWPNRPEPRAALAAALIDLGRPREALAEYDQALRLAPDRQDIRQLRARLAAQLPPDPATQSRPTTQP